MCISYSKKEEGKKKNEEGERTKEGVPAEDVHVLSGMHRFVPQQSGIGGMPYVGHKFSRTFFLVSFPTIERARRTKIKYEDFY